MPDSLFNFLLSIEFCKVMKLTILPQNDFFPACKKFLYVLASRKQSLGCIVDVDRDIGRPIFVIFLYIDIG